MNMKFNLWILTLLAIFIAIPASAVMLSPNKHGQVLIFPYFGTLGGNSTNITVSSDDGDEKALKVLLFNKLGNAIMSFNVYVGARASWVASLSQVDGKTLLKIPSGSCTLSEYGDGSDVIELPLRSGFVEVIEMGSISDDDISIKIKDEDCNALNAMWADNGQWSQDPGFGMAAPTGKLRGSATLINVERGTVYSFVASALTQFSNISQHTAPDRLLPDLTSAHDAGTDNGETTSVICNEFECTEDTWARPVDAVAAVLTTHELSGDFTTEANIGALAEVVVTYPLRAFYSSQTLNEPQLLLEIYDRSGHGDQGGRFGCLPLISSFCAGTYSKRSTESIDIVSFSDSVNDEGMIKTSGILAEDYLSFFPTQDIPTIPASGAVWIGFETPIPEALTSVSGWKYLGVPAVALVLQQYTNGYLQGADGEKVLANYGGEVELSRFNKRLRY